MEGRGDVLILSSNNYLGLCSEPSVVEAGRGARKYGAGTGSVRFICGTFTVHRELEEALARFSRHGVVAVVRVGVERERGVHGDGRAGGRLRRSPTRSTTRRSSTRCGSRRRSRSARRPCTSTRTWTICVTSSRARRARGAGSSGPTASSRWKATSRSCPRFCELARAHDAIVVMDDSHATGVLGETGRGTAEHYGVLGEVDVITSTLGKALGGAAGGFTAGPAALTDYLTQRSRPQLFSNALPPTVAASALAAVRVHRAASGAREQAAREREVLPRGDHGGGIHAARWRHADRADHRRRDGARARDERAMLREGVFVTGFGFPVVPQGHARIRCQLSAAHSDGRSRFRGGDVQEGRDERSGC